ncbi:hypothetical protein [Clostridium sp. DL-VIII]|uniref:hypothetical protein n=1 Tax=Clostridium sp. DL-VIII TaxID=641107 RepID=UPI00054FC21C|nr:hypothetical protein [Clostridium sp. DL-VIII]
MRLKQKITINNKNYKNKISKQNWLFCSLKIENREKIDFQELQKVEALGNTRADERRWCVGKGSVLEELVTEKL